MIRTKQLRAPVRRDDARQHRARHPVRLDGVCDGGPRCCCGCGEEVVTPFSPAQWQMSFDGEAVSLHPSIGNWNCVAVRTTWSGKAG